MTQGKHKTSETREPAATNLRNFRTFLLMQQLEQHEIGARIAQARREAGGMTQEELADLLNVSKRSVQEYEAGNTIPWKHFNRLEEVFPGRGLGWFLHGTGEDAIEPDEDADLAQRLASIESEIRELRRVLEGLATAVRQLGSSAR